MQNKAKSEMGVGDPLQQSNQSSRGTHFLYCSNYSDKNGISWVELKRLSIIPTNKPSKLANL